MFGIKLVRKLLKSAPSDIKIEAFKSLLEENGILVDDLSDAEILKMYERFCNLSTGIKGDGPLVSKFNKWLLGEAVSGGDSEAIK